MNRIKHSIHVFFLFALFIGVFGLLQSCKTTDGPPPINKSAVAAQNGAAVLMNGAAVAVQTCVLDKASDEGRYLGIAFNGVVATFDDMSDRIEAGDTNAANLLLEAGKSAFTQIQLALAGLEPTPAQDTAIKARTLPATKASFNEIIVMINQFMPIILSSGTTIAHLIEGLIQNVKAPNADVGIDDVLQANANMQAALSVWAAAACVR